MLASVLIAKKRDGGELSQSEIEFLIGGYVDESIPDYQISAWAMAVFLRGMSPSEIEYLTDAMIASGASMTKLDNAIRVDKHSTGGLGDKTSLILAPLLALFDLHVPMISGRGLGITGGTLDKLEAIPGFRTDLSQVEINSALSQIGCVITGATRDLVPADRKLYALRDVTATVPSIPLITASIMSKKLAESLDSLVLDVKWGTGAFMQDRDSAIALAHSLIRIGRRMGVNTRALLSDMNQPLGKMVGNALEVNESIEILQGNGPDETRCLTIELGAVLLVDTDKATSLPEARSRIEAKLKDGSAWERFQQMVSVQGGSIDRPLPVAKHFPFLAKRSGRIESIDGQRLGQAVISLGGGRRIAGERIDPAVGLEMECRIGDAVSQGDKILTVYSRSEADFVAIQPLLREAFRVGDQSPTFHPLFEPLDAPTNT